MDLFLPTDEALRCVADIAADRRQPYLVASLEGGFFAAPLEAPDELQLVTWGGLRPAALPISLTEHARWLVDEHGSVHEVSHGGPSD